MASEIVEDWLDSRDKDQLHYYEDAEFQDYYVEHEMPKKTRLVRNWTARRVEDLVTSTCCTSYRILSLGCGPGSDLLGVMEAFQRVARQQHAVGVDVHRWPWADFEDSKLRMRDRGPISRIGSTFRVSWMEDFVTQTDCRFHLIVCCFTGVKDKTEFVANELPRLLEDGGRIFVIDNNLKGVRRLQDFGFRCRTARDSGLLFLELQRPQEHSSEEDSEEESEEYSEECSEYDSEEAGYCGYSDGDFY